MNYQEVLDTAVGALQSLKGRTLDILTVKKPKDLQSAIGLSKVISKLSPIVGNTIETAVAQDLNLRIDLWPSGCQWLRQDPDFPDVVLNGFPEPRPGFEVKAWLPLATEITGRFRDSQTMLDRHNTRVAVICWLPEFVIAGQPKVIDIFVCDAIDVARARDTHYHQPPTYIVREPEDTTSRTANLRQKNCNGYRLQSTSQIQAAQSVVDSWGPQGKTYQTDPTYQAKLITLTNQFVYRLDTNFAKIDRIGLPSLEAFKRQILATTYLDRTIEEWIKALKTSDAKALAKFIDGPPPSEAQIEELSHLEVDNEGEE